MVTACLDSPVSSLVTDKDCVEPGNMRKTSSRTWRGTPSPALRRARTITRVTQEQLKTKMPGHQNGAAAAAASVV